MSADPTAQAVSDAAYLLRVALRDDDGRLAPADEVSVECFDTCARELLGSLSLPRELLRAARARRHVAAVYVLRPTGSR